jgi:hypothetical protein
VRSGAFEVIEIEWIEDANRRGLFQNLTKYEQNEFLDTLFQFSKSKMNPKISERANEVYQQIKMSGVQKWILAMIILSFNKLNCKMNDEENGLIGAIEKQSKLEEEDKGSDQSIRLSALDQLKVYRENMS